MTDRLETNPIPAAGRWKWALLVGVLLVLAIGAYIYFEQPWGPGPNGPWSAADHNHDGMVTRAEMDLFGKQKPHRNHPRLMMHFDSADTDHDGVVTQAEIDVYGIDIGSRDPYNHRDKK